MEKSTKSLPKILHITWIDSEVLNEWTSIEDTNQELHEIHSVGFLIHETSDSLVLALSFDRETNHANAIMYIPRAAVKTVKVLNGRTRRSKR